MSKLALNNEFGLYVKDEIPMCSSRQVAEIFDKRHDNVLSDIRNLDCSDEFRLLNFKESSYINSQNKKQPEFLMTKNGFVFLVMGYRGEKAAKFKEAYIGKFDQMEEFIATLRTARLEYPEMTAAIQAAHEDPKSYHYSNEANLINRIVLGKTAKQIKEILGIKAGESIRPYLSAIQIKWIEKLQKRNTVYIEDGLSYEERKAKMMVYFSKVKPLALDPWQYTPCLSSEHDEEPEEE